VSGPVILENVPLAPLTTLGIGGPARFFLDAERENDIAHALDFARTRSCPAFILGGGSNVLVSDAGFPGLVVRVGILGVQGFGDDDPGFIRVAAGEPWDPVVQSAVEQGLAGIECLSGIPGNTGGTPVQNVGAYGQEVSEVIVNVRALDRGSLAVTDFSPAECGFGYRSSIFNTTEAGHYVILRVDFRLKQNGAPKLEYPELRRQFEGCAGPPTLTEVREAVLRTRTAKSMVVTPGDPESRSAGSFFRNPVVDLACFNRITEAARSKGMLRTDEAPPSYPAPGGAVKVPAAWLIERAGFVKGYSRGRAGVSRRHTLALVNRGGATAAELLALAREIQDGVREAFSVDLVPEPVFVGF
jgi:UDP-N-acetylmuramate dehydrogenase